MPCCSAGQQCGRAPVHEVGRGQTQLGAGLAPVVQRPLHDVERVQQLRVALRGAANPAHAVTGTVLQAVRRHRCAQPAERRERYDRIGEYVKGRKLSCLVDFEYCDAAIRSSGEPEDGGDSHDAGR